MKIPCLHKNGQATDLDLSESVFGRDYNEALVHQIIKAYLHNARQGTRSQKGRSEVSGSTRKLWRQKGTGRARVGAASNPLWRSGGKIFPNKPDERFSHKVNRRMYRAGVSTILSQLLRNGRLSLVEEFSVETHKTKELAQLLKSYQQRKIMIVTELVDKNLHLASRNLPDVKIINVAQLDPVSLLHYEKIIVTQEAIKKIESVLL